MVIFYYTECSEIVNEILAINVQTCHHYVALIGGWC